MSKLPSQEQEKKTTPKEKPSTKIPDDLFGLNHPIVKHYHSFSLSQLEKNYSPSNSLHTDAPFSKVPLLSVSQPLELMMDVWLHDFGIPFQHGNLKWSPLNHLISRRQFYSLSSPHKLIIYFQCVVILHEREYYCIVEENPFNSSVYYHTNEKYLVDKFFEAVYHKREKLKSSEVQR